MKSINCNVCILNSCFTFILKFVYIHTKIEAILTKPEFSIKVSEEVFVGRPVPCEVDRPVKPVMKNLRNKASYLSI